MHRGFTLLEALVALVLLELGLFAVLATSATAARDLGLANRRLRAQWLAADRVEQLRGSACSAAESGQATAPGGLHEHWSIQALGARRIVVDSVEAHMPDGRATSVVVRAWLLCD